MKKSAVALISALLGGAAATSPATTITLNATTTGYRYGTTVAEPNATVAGLTFNARSHYSVTTAGTSGTLTYDFQIDSTFPYPYLHIQTRGELFDATDPGTRRCSIKGEYQIDGGSWVTFFDNYSPTVPMIGPRSYFLPVTTGVVTQVKLKYTATRGSTSQSNQYSVQLFKLADMTDPAIGGHTYTFQVAGVKPIRLSRAQPVHTYTAYVGNKGVQDTYLIQDPNASLAFSDDPTAKSYYGTKTKVSYMDYLVLLDPGAVSLDVRSRVMSIDNTAGSQVVLRSRTGLACDPPFSNVQTWVYGNPEFTTNTIPVASGTTAMMLRYLIDNRRTDTYGSYSIQLHRYGVNPSVPFTWTVAAEYAASGSVILLK